MNNNYNRIIIGIDPGTNIMGYGVIGITNSTPHYIDMGTVSLRKLNDSYLKLQNIFQSVQKLIEKYLPDEMAIEAPFYGKNIQSMLKLGRAQGVAIAAALLREVPIREYEPRKIKLSVTGRGSATKEQVKEMVFRIMNLKTGQDVSTLDATDALAIALCHFYESSHPKTGNSPQSWKEYILHHPEKIRR